MAYISNFQNAPGNPIKYPAQFRYTFVDTALPYAAKASFTSRVAAGGVVSPAIQPNSLVAGSCIEFDAWGTYSSTGTPTFTLDLGFGTSSSLPAATGLTIGMVTGSGVTNVNWVLEGRYLFTSATAAIGSMTVATTEAAYIAVNNAVSLVTADVVALTSTNYLCLGLTCSANSSSNSITVGGLGFRLV